MINHEEGMFFNMVRQQILTQIYSLSTEDIAVNLARFCFYFTMMFTSGAIMMEKVVGHLDRSMVAGMTYLEIVGAHLVVQFILMTAQKSVMLFVFYVCFDNPFLGSVALAVFFLLLIESIGIAFGFMLTEVFTHERLSSYAGIGATLAIFSSGGIIWPIEGAHPVLRSCINLFPVAPAIESYKAITSKGYNLDHPIVYRGYFSSVVWIAILSFITVLVAMAKKSRSIT